ncbi:MAG TPA: SPFH domain-containing protein [Limnochordia bacterium]|nr:SPFH domain-containing protein [Limnochordia bacterium]
MIVNVSEKSAFTLSGGVMFLVALIVLALGAWLIAAGAIAAAAGSVVAGCLILLAGILTLCGLFIVQPNQARVITLFGRYVGSVRKNGWLWTNPFTVRKSISLRIHNFNSEKLKVNDAHGNPIEIAAVVVWRVVDTAKATFDVESYQDFVAIQSETAIRHLASAYAYDANESGEKSLRANAQEVADDLGRELQARLGQAGVEVTDARLSHLAYAPEIAGAMLQRQQASAIVAAREKIVEGAVGMVQEALRVLAESHVVELDEERKAAMVSNLMVVLCSERGTQPVVNAGSLY